MKKLPIPLYNCAEMRYNNGSSGGENRPENS